MTSSLHPLDADTRSEAEAILEANDLPVRGLEAETCTLFGAFEEDTLVAIGALEQYGPHGLLRSIAVPQPHRGMGHGREVVSEIETIATARGVETLYLLTTTAADFFEHVGYRRSERDAAPETIRQTTEFAEVCPSSAVCMRKEL